MALQLNLADTNVGLPAPEAYARIAALSFDTMTGLVRVAVDIHASLAARVAGKNPIGGGTYEGIVGLDMPTLDADIPGIRSVIYTWLKTLPAFAGAIDV
jgi:hypothetical protein